MPTGLDHVLNTPQIAIGKGTVGEPAPPPEGKEGLDFKVALFFDGTMNNRSNTNARTDRHDSIIDKKHKDLLSSYANFYSNVAILEYMNLRKKGSQQEVSVYIEGIGTVDFVEGATEKDKHGADKLDRHGNKIPVAAADNANDQQAGYAFGTGPTGIVDRVTKGILKAKARIKKSYKSEDQYIRKITIDVVGFSRGAAAARHFVSRHKDLRGPWEKQPSPPELVVNFVGLFETVSSYDESSNVLANGAKDKWGRLFTRNVSQLQLALGAVPKRVVHLMAQHEFRYNFALTNIDSSLRAGVGFEVYLPGVHSDVGGGYVEPDPKNPTLDPALPQGVRDLNRERRQLTGPDEERYLLEQGWYTAGQLAPSNWERYVRHRTWEDHQVLRAQQEGRSYSPAPYTGSVHGTRYLGNEYQYLTLYLMLGLAQQTIGTGQHEPMTFSSPDETRYASYRVPADLRVVRQHFEDYVTAHAGSTKSGLAVGFADEEQAKKVRNKYLHRSTVLFGESKITTYLAYKRAKHDTWVVFSDADNVAPAAPVEVPDLSTVTLEQLPAPRLRELGLSLQE